MKTEITHQPAIAYKKRTISWIIWHKFLDCIEWSSLSWIMRFILLLNISIIITLTLNYTEEMIDVFQRIFEAYDFFLIKALWVFFLVFNYKEVFNLFLKTKKKKKEYKPLNNTIEWIPVFELLDHLFTHESFSRQDIEAKFWISRSQFQKLVSKLDELKILVRWENNARILNNEFSRQDLAKMIDWKTSAKEISKPMYINKNWTFSFRPMWLKIKKEVENKINTPLHEELFKIKRIGQTA